MTLLGLIIYLYASATRIFAISGIYTIKRDSALSDVNYEKQAQDYYGKAPIIILGSDASAAHGMSGMRELAQHLIDNTNVSRLSDAEMESWGIFCRTLTNGVDLEAALHQVPVSEELTCRIINSTWSLINSEDCSIFKNDVS